AIVLETVSRAVTVAFKIVPMRIGVDEASSSFAAGRLHLDPVVGLAVALVRKLRLLVWSAVGLTLLVRRRGRNAASSTLRMRGALAPFALLVLVFVSAPHVARAQGDASIAGSVSIAAPDGSSTVIPGVTLTLSCGSRATTEVSDEQG